MIVYPKWRFFVPFNAKYMQLVICLIFIWATPVTAHQLSVFAWVEGETVMVEGRLPKGRHPQLGTVLVYDGKDRLLLTTKLRTDGTASFPLENWETGFRWDQIDEAEKIRDHGLRAGQNGRCAFCFQVCGQVQQVLAAAEIGKSDHWLLCAEVIVERLFNRVLVIFIGDGYNNTIKGRLV